MCRASKRSLIVWCAVSGQAPCSGAKRQGKEIDEVSSAILGDEVAKNVLLWGARLFARPYQQMVNLYIYLRIRAFLALLNQHYRMSLQLLNLGRPKMTTLGHLHQKMGSNLS